MAIARTSYPERVLIVLNADGSLKGAHQETLEQVIDGADVLSAKMLPAAPLDAATLASVLPSQGALAAQVQALTAERNALQTERDQLIAEKNAALAPLNS